MTRVPDLWPAACGCAVLVAACIAPPAGAQVLSHGPSSRFEALFEETHQPIFVRPDVSSLFPTAEPLVRDDTPEATPTTTAEAEAATDAPAPLAVGAKTAAKLVNELVISPAESAPAPPERTQEVAAVSGDGASAPAPIDEPPQAQSTGAIGQSAPPSAPPQDATRFAATGPLPPVRTGRRLAVTRAAWYQHSGRTATGEKYNPDGLTAAHRTLPLGSRVRVVNRENGRSVVVRINDRVPKTAKLPVDLSRGSARAIGINGIAPVALYEVE
jgi:rare lipoprotein A